MLTYANHSGGGILNKAINSLPFELHIPGYQYCGPGTKLQKRLARNDPGINPLDAACKVHDIAYSQSNDLSARHRADKVLQEKAWQRVKSKDASFGEKAAAWTVVNAMKAKRKFGMGIRRGKKRSSNKDKNRRMKKNKCMKQKKQKTGGFLPIAALLPLIGKAIVAGAASGAASYGMKKLLSRGKGLYMHPYKRGAGVKNNKKKTPLKYNLPNRPLTDADLRKYGKYIPHFRNVYMRDNLPNKARKYECGIINLDNVNGPGTHWVAYKKSGNVVQYYDSFGNLNPPNEVIRYFGKNIKIFYNHKREQKFNSFRCGHLCLKFLINTDTFSE